MQKYLTTQHTHQNFTPNRRENPVRYNGNVKQKKFIETAENRPSPSHQVNHMPRRT